MSFVPLRRTSRSMTFLSLIDRSLVAAVSNISLDGQSLVQAALPVGLGQGVRMSRDLLFQLSSVPSTPVSELVEAVLQNVHQSLDKFKVLWLDGYLLSLRETNRNPIKEGDIVLISSPVKSRSQWQMGRVLKVLPLPCADRVARSGLAFYCQSGII